MDATFNGICSWNIYVYKCKTSEFSNKNLKPIKFREI